ncbi:hypothetical protein HX747_11860 [Streptomyces sp. L06]|nr:hypothetical protein [Streptomyces sp. L06]
MSVFYAGFGVVLAGFLFGMMTYQMAPRLPYRRRMASLGAFSVLGGFAVALITGSLGFDALPGSFLGIAGIVALMAAAVGGTTMAFMRLFGKAGMSLASVVLLILGNATSGGTLPPPTFRSGCNRCPTSCRWGSACAPCRACRTSTTTGCSSAY